MGSVDIIKPVLLTVLSSDVIKSQQHQKKNSWERWESNQGLLGEKQECYICAMLPPGTAFIYGSGFRRENILKRLRRLGYWFPPPPPLIATHVRLSQRLIIWPWDFDATMTIDWLSWLALFMMKQDCSHQLWISETWVYWIENSTMII